MVVSTALPSKVVYDTLTFDPDCHRSPLSRPGQTHLAVLRFDFGATCDEIISVKELCRVTAAFDFAQPLVLRGDRLVVQGFTNGETLGEHKTTLIAIDHKKSLIFSWEDRSLDLTVSHFDTTPD